MCQGVVATCCDYKVFTVLSSNFLKIFIIFFGSLELGIELAHCGKGGGATVGQHVCITSQG